METVRTDADRNFRACTTISRPFLGACRKIRRVLTMTRDDFSEEIKVSSAVPRERPSTTTASYARRN